MAETTGIVCDLCESRNRSKSAYIWCSVCEEGLCIDCSEYHRVSKLSKQHETLSIDSYRKLPECIRTLSKTCLVHDEPLELYCGTHQEPCCTECIATKHSLCPGTTLLSKTVKGIRDSEYLASTKRRIARMKLHAEEMKQNRRANIERLEKQGVLVCTEVARIKDETNKHLTEIEAKLVNEINELVMSETESCKNAESKMEDRLSKLQDLEKGISETESYGNKEQIYLGLKHLTDCLATEETTLKSNMEESCFQEKAIELILAEEMKLLTTISSMGTIKLNVKPTVISSIEPNSSAQMFSPNEASYSSMTISNIKRGTAGSDCIEGTRNTCSLVQLPDGRIVLAAANEAETFGYFYVFDADGHCIERKFSFQCPFGLALMNQKLIASFNIGMVAENLDLEDFTRISEIADGNIYGLSCYDNILAMAIKGEGITLAKEDENPFKTINVRYRSLAYIHLWKNKLFYSDFTLFVLSRYGWRRNLESEI
ncbi:TRIM45 [Mytilus coruscus]|uniref:TRIM45 n=1 Tax=Mytilus coruscus TaxID=42192 RepID=A0A6J8BQH5_MYTCO|nr:TRIM45 [Mytilus coruscus]